ncbi:MAG: DUF547 domain-containing protein [Myxococcota bacterium]
MTLWLGLVALSGCRQGMRSTADVPPTVREDYDSLLAKVVTPDGYVDYDALEADRGPLDAYIAFIGDPASWPGKSGRDWHGRFLNAYNALSMFQVLERDRPSSVQEPRGWLPRAGSRFFFETAFLVRGEWLSLSEIEHERVRQLELDLRDHAALNCASMSCPPLRNELYAVRGADLRNQLTDQMHRWMRDEARGVRIEDDVAVFNPIFDWFAGDFEFFSAGLDPCAIASQYSKGQRRDRLESLSADGCPHRFFEYDWALNDASHQKDR